MDLKLGHYNKDGIEVVDVEGEIDVYTAPRLRELLGVVRGVATAAFSPNGKMIVTAGWDPADRPPIYSSAQIVSAEVCCPLDELLALASGRVTRSLTGAERVIYLHEPAGGI